MKALDIERLLSWAYCDELSKLAWLGLGFSAWDAVTAQAETMCQSDDGRSLGSRYAALYQGGPHPDAKILDAAVKGLSAFTPVLHEDAALLLGDMPEAVQAEAEAALENYHVELAALIVRMAKMRARPDWRTAIPVRKAWAPDGWRGHPPYFRLEAAAGPFGAVATVERRVLRDLKTRRPPAGAYHKWVFEPPVALAISGRADYLCWRAALQHIAETVALAAHKALPPQAPELPWLGEAEKRKRVLEAVA